MRFQRSSSTILALLCAVAIAGSGCITSPFESHLVKTKASEPDGSGAQIVQITLQRPVSDFISVQGSTSLFFSPLPDYIGWTNNNPQTRFALIDYTGKAAAYLQSNGGPTLGTQVTGSVSERRLANGTAEVSVVLHTTRALSWAVSVANIAGPLLYGYRGADLLANPSLKPALSSVHMRVVFTNDSPGAPLPDLVNAFFLGNATPAQHLRFLQFESSGDGPLRPSAGVTDGTPGRLHVIQTGIFVTSGGGATADGFPAEKVELRTVGRGTALQ